MADIVDLERRAIARDEDWQDTIPEQDISSMMGGFMITEAQAQQFCDPDWVYENLIIEGHITVIAAEPNGGKTTIIFGLSGVMAQKGYEVHYFNADISASDAKTAVPQANSMGVKLYLPDIAGGSMHAVVERLKILSQQSLRLDRQVLIFDTLKKMASVMHKESASALFALLRKVAAKGATIVLLAHTNKYYDSEGLPVFEGVGDIRSDCDNLVYLIPRKNNDGSMVVSTSPSKTRGEFKKISFEIDPERRVTLLRDYQDIKGQKALERRERQDQESIDEIIESIRAGHRKQSEICSNCTMSKNKTIRILRRYTGRQWKTERRENNSIYYTLLPANHSTNKENYSG